MDKHTVEKIKQKLKKRALVISFMPFVIRRLVAILIDLRAKGPENVDVFKEYYYYGSRGILKG